MMDGPVRVSPARLLRSSEDERCGDISPGSLRIDLYLERLLSSLPEVKTR